MCEFCLLVILQWEGSAINRATPSRFKRKPSASMIKFYINQSIIKKDSQWTFAELTTFEKPYCLITTTCVPEKKTLLNQKVRLITRAAGPDLGNMLYFSGTLVSKTNPKKFNISELIPKHFTSPKKILSCKFCYIKNKVELYTLGLI